MSIKKFFFFHFPQCSVLGPMFFTMYIKPLSAIIDSHLIIHHSIADELQMSARSDKVYELLCPVMYK